MRDDEFKSSGLLFFQSGADFGHDLLEGRLIMNRDVRKNLAVDRDVRKFQPFNEAAVGDSLGTDGRTETGDPESAEIALTGFAIAVGPIFTLHLRVFRVAEEFGAATAIALRGIDDPFAAGAAGWSVSGSWHVLLKP
jgi:hypothetical protein